MDFKDLQNKTKLQKEGKDAVRNANYNAAILMATGTGKGKVMLDLARELVEAKKVKSILYLCDRQNLRDSESSGFPEQIQKWFPEYANLIQLECYQTVCKWSDEKYDLVLADEFDAAITPAYIKAILNNEFKYKILVSGTLSENKRRTVKKIVPIVFEALTEEAEQKGVINKTNYYFCNYCMTEAESKEYQRLTTKIQICFNDDLPYAENKTLQFWIRKRKDFLSNLDSSRIFTRQVMQKIYKDSKDNRTIIFCERTEQADKICKYSYHGKNEGEDNLQKFVDGEVNAMSTVSKVERGLNVPNVNYAIFEGLSSSSTKFDQKNGRLKRLGINQYATVIFMVPWFKKLGPQGPYWKPTVVQDWISKATANLTEIKFEIWTN